MSDYSSLKATINANIKANNNHEITGAITNSVLNAMVDSLGAGYQFIGVATPTNPGSAQTPDYKCFYLATTPGTYTNLGGLVVADGEVAILKYDTSWTKEVTGAATADQVSQLGQEVAEKAGGSYLPQMTIEQGSLSSSTGEESSALNRLRNDGYVIADIIKIATSGNKVYVFGYKEDNTFVSATGWITTNQDVQITGADKYRLSFAYSNDAPIIPSDYDSLGITIEAECMGELNKKMDGLVFDVSKENNGATFASLSALLSDANLSALIPSDIRTGGMTIRFIQTSDSAYHQYRLMKNTWSASVSDWQGLDDNPIVINNDAVSNKGVNLMQSRLVHYIDTNEFVIGNIKVTPGSTTNVIFGFPLNKDKQYTFAFSGTSSSCPISFYGIKNDGTSEYIKSADVNSYPNQSITPSSEYGSIKLEVTNANQNESFNLSIKQAQTLIDTSDIQNGAVTPEKVSNDIALKSDFYYTYDTSDSSYLGVGTKELRTGLTFGNKIPSPATGKIKKLKYYSYAGLPFHVLVANMNGTTITAISSTLVTPASSGYNETDVNIGIQAGQYVLFAQQSGGDEQIPLFSQANTTPDWVGAIGRSAYKAAGDSFETLGDDIAAWSFSASYVVYVDKYVEIVPEITTTTVTATRNQADYNSIRELMESLDASYYNRYIIKIPKGRWFECDIKGKEYIKLVGEDMYGTILYNNGSSENLTPSDYSFEQYSGVAMNTIDRQYKHIINQRSENLECENITFEGSNVKYCAHLDSTLMLHAKFKNCRFIIETNVPYCVGIGSGTTVAAKTFDFDGCEFISNDRDRMYGIYFHNWNNVSYPSRLSVANSYFNGIHFAVLSELGSGQQDNVDFLNCYSSRETSPHIEVMVEKGGDGKPYWVNPATGQKVTDPTLVPYCIKINGLGSNIAGLKYREFNTGEGNPRPDEMGYCFLENKIWLN